MRAIGEKVRSKLLLASTSSSTLAAGAAPRMWWLRGAALTARAPLFSAFRDVLSARTMKVMSSIRKRCGDCRIVRRGNISYVFCKTHPRHKARQGPKRRQDKPQAPPASSSVASAGLEGVRGHVFGYL